MCPRFTLTQSATSHSEYFGLFAFPEIKPRFNIAPTQPVLCLKHDSADIALAILRCGVHTFLFRALEIDKLLDHFDDEIILNWIAEQGLDGAVAIAKHLPRPYLAEDGSPCLPELTRKVVEDFGEEQDFVERFSIPRGGGFGWVGNLVQQAAERIGTAEKFVSHKSKAIRRLADENLP